MSDTSKAVQKPRSQDYRIISVLLVFLGFVLLYNFFAPAGSPELPNGQFSQGIGDLDEFTQLVRRSPEEPEISVRVPWRPRLTVYEATLLAADVDPEHWQSSWRGEGKMAFLTELGGVANRGAEGLNWIFSVNDEESDLGAGAVELECNARVLWEFTDYR